MELQHSTHSTQTTRGGGQRKVQKVLVGEVEGFTNIVPEEEKEGTIRGKINLKKKIKKKKSIEKKKEDGESINDFILTSAGFITNRILIASTTSAEH